MTDLAPSLPHGVSFEQRFRGWLAAVFARAESIAATARSEEAGTPEADARPAQQQTAIFTEALVMFPHL